MHASGFLTYLIYFTTNNGQKIAHSWLLPHFTKTLKRRSRPAPPLPHRARAQPSTGPGSTTEPGRPWGRSRRGWSRSRGFFGTGRPRTGARSRRPGPARPRLPSARRRHGSRAPWRGCLGRHFVGPTARQGRVLTETDK